MFRQVQSDLFGWNITPVRGKRRMERVRERFVAGCVIDVFSNEVDILK